MQGDEEQGSAWADRGSGVADVWHSYRYRDNLPENGLMIDGRPALTGIDPTRVGRYVVLTVRDPLAAGDQDQAKDLASRFGTPERVGDTGLFQTWTARLGETSVTVVGTGSGAPELELALIELMEHTEAEVFVYFGAAAGFSPQVHPGDVVVSSGVVRDEGMSRSYIGPSFPAVASYDVVAALATAATNLDVRFHVGVTRSSDSDVVGVGRPAVGGYMQPQHAELIDYYVRAGVLSNDREASAVISLSTLFGRRCGAVLGVADNCVLGAPIQPGLATRNAVEVLVDGLQQLEEYDESRLRRRQTYWTPDA